MRDVNLLPQELKPKGYAVKLAKKLRQFALVTLIAFLIALAFYVASYALLSIQVRESISKQNRLKNEIRALEQTEQKLILLQDRVGKVGTILSSEDASEEAQILKEVISNLPSDVFIRSVTLSETRSNVVIFTTSSLHLTRFLAQIINSNYEKIELLSFSYRDVEGGYEVEVGISK